MSKSKLDLFRKLFRGRNDVYGISKGGCIKQAISDDTILDHIDRGTQHIGIYPLLQNNSSHWMALDFDRWKYEEVKEAWKKLKACKIAGYIESSKSKGFHIWIFFEQPIQASKSRLVIRRILEQVKNGKSYELFPKQDFVLENGYGNYINLPLFAPLAKEEKTVFINADGDDLPYANQWGFLESIEKVSEQIFDEFKVNNQLILRNSEQLASAHKSNPENYGLPCVPKMMLGVEEGCRNQVALTLAKHFRNASLPKQKVIEMLVEWDAKNLPPLGAPIIQTKVNEAYKKGYKGYDCDVPIMKQFCDQTCPIFRKKQIQYIGELHEITSAQDFFGGKAYLTVPIKELRNDKMVKTMYLVSSERQKFELNEKNLIGLGLYSERYPCPDQRWSNEGLNAFLEGNCTPNISESFDLIKHLLEQYIDFGNQSWSSFFACWIIGTYFHRMFGSYPYIHLNGNMESGKTKTLMLASGLAFNAELTFDSSTAYAIRTIHDNNAVCCIDEAEKYKTSRNEDAQLIIGMCNAGYKKGAFCGKAEQGSDGRWNRKKFDAYSPKIFAGIKGLEPTLASRCVPITMVKTDNVKIKNNEIKLTDQMFQKIRDQLYEIELSYHGEISRNYLEITDKDIVGREWELWKPIFCIVKAIENSSVAKSNLFGEMRDLALDVQNRKKETSLEETIAPKLLQLLKEMIEKQPGMDNFYPVAEIVKYLSESGEDSFAWLLDDNRFGKGRWLGNELRKAGIVNGCAIQKKIDGRNAKGFNLGIEAIEKRLRSFGL
ncbi:MAG: hypothetical protein WC890_04250 [Candidatus Margulisiibacteriota bacterium]